MPWVGVYARFPQYRARSGKVDLIEDRINDCFRRSMNGRALDPAGPDMRDIITYFAFLSTGLPVGVEMEGQGLPPLRPVPGDIGRGVAVFTATCARCHGAGGQGTALAPPLWGPKSYNVGAGMARINTAASFIHALMPIDRAQQLTQQQAFDVATYINTRPRPNFPPKVRDWPQRRKNRPTRIIVRPAPVAVNQVQLNLDIRVSVTFSETEWKPQASHHDIAVNIGTDSASLMQNGARMRPPETLLERGRRQDVECEAGGFRGRTDTGS